MRLLHYFICLILSGLLPGCKPSPAPLFEKIEAGQSGVTFSNTIDPNDSLNAFTFTNFYNGGGVGIGDFNHDGRPDLFFTGNQVSCQLYLNQTGVNTTDATTLRFEDITTSAGVTTTRWCTGVSVVDINQDGWDDIYVSVAAHPTLKQSRNLLFINQKTINPTFREEAARYGLDYDGFTTQTAFFDYDRDGDLDAFLLNTAPDVQNPSYLRPTVNDGSYPSTDRLYRNEGIGPAGHPVFRDVSAQAGIRFEGLGLGVVISDLNGDGWPDMYGSCDFISSDVLYLNNGNGEFGGPTFRNTIKTSMAHTSLYGMGVDAADLNNDGRPDLLQLDMLPETNQRLKQMLAGQDYDKKEQSLLPQFNYQLQYMRNTLQLNTGNQHGTPLFSEVGLLAGLARTDWSWATLLADLDQDGQRDVFITNGYRKNVTDRDFISFTEEFDMFGTDAARQKQRDKLLGKIPEIKLPNYAYRNRSGLSFQDVSAAWGLDELSYANGAAYADLDRDGDLDLIINNIDQRASIFKNNTRERGQTSFLSASFVGSVTNRAGLGAALTVWTKGQQQVFENQPVRGYLSSVETGVVLGMGKATQADSVRVQWPDGRTETRYRVAVNQRLIFRYPAAKSAPVLPVDPVKTLFKLDSVRLDYVHRESDFIDFKTTPALHKMRSRNGPAVGTGDLNGDGLDDIVVGPSGRSGPGQLSFGQPGGGFKSESWLTDAVMETGDVLLFDSDGDGDRDVLLVGGGNERPLTVTEAYQPTLYLNNGRGRLTPAPNALPRFALSSQATRAFDYDNDGDLDLLITGRQLPGQYPLPASSCLLRNDNGKFSDVTQRVAPALLQLGLVCDALPLDVDTDGDMDVVLAGEWMPPTLLRNDNGRFNSVPLTNDGPAASGWWNCVSAGDFDHDGDPDLLLGNEGLNTIFRASANEPVQMMAKDFNHDGLIDPIMGYYLQGISYPALPREALNQQMIQFRRTYKRYADYASATFNDLFTPAERAGAWTGQVSQLQSCYAENLGNGTFRLRPLPKLAQVAPAAGFLVNDFDGDGCLDALLTGNFYANEVNMGRQDASQGLWLRGNGRGGFVAVGPETSGFRVRGNAHRSYRLRPGNRVITAVAGGRVLVHSWQ